MLNITSLQKSSWGTATLCLSARACTTEMEDTCANPVFLQSSEHEPKLEYRDIILKKLFSCMQDWRKINSDSTEIIESVIKFEHTYT